MCSAQSRGYISAGDNAADNTAAAFTVIIHVPLIMMWYSTVLYKLSHVLTTIVLMWKSRVPNCIPV